MIRYFERHIIQFQLAIVLVGGLGLSFMSGYSALINSGLLAFAENTLLCILIAFILGWPIVVGVMNLYYLFRKRPYDKLALSNERICSISTIVIGGVLMVFALGFLLDVTWKPWDAQLVNNQMHAPLDITRLPIVFTMALCWVIGYFGLRIVNVKKVPPLIPVIFIAMMYIGFVLDIVWAIQTVMSLIKIKLDFFNFLAIDYYFVNLWIVSATLIRSKVAEYNDYMKNGGNVINPKTGGVAKFLSKSTNWPVASLLVMWPILAICICFLLLFGQRPDDIIKVWTETSDWTLSMKQGPVNLVQDEHYLCTASATGHEALVKPIRMGQRHGHRVIVNRQLCIANAFEQVLEERTPRFHYHVRKFYDTYGFPVAKLITTPLRADVVYILMKPLEYLFLAVLYLFTVNPEERIATQYIPAEDARKIIEVMRGGK